MMDTRILLLSLFEPEKLQDKILKILEDESAEKYLSNISFWEISLKYSLGKLELTDVDPEEVYQSSIKAGYYVLEIRSHEFSSLFKLPYFPGHHDPFDRMIIWQALLHDMTLITTEKVILEYEKAGLPVIV